MPASVSVIVPVYNAADDLRLCLAALMPSLRGAGTECIVVDDGSSDNSAAIARQSEVVVLSTGGRKGPAFARNIGAKAARGEILFFIDADVCVHPDTLQRIRTAFDEDALLDGVIGSYDDSPPSQNFLSVYKNLLHHFTHQTARRDACTFWSGCGAIRSEVFREHGGFDEGFKRPAIEDIELGYRLIRAGKTLVLDRHIQVKHRKKWSFFGLLKTDILDRGIPWTELMLRANTVPNDLNVQLSQRVSVALMYLLLITASIAAWRWGDAFIIPVLTLLAVALGRYWVEGVRPAESRTAAIFITLFTGGVACCAWRDGMPALLPPLVIVYGLIFLRYRYSASGTVARDLNSVMLGFSAAAALITVFVYLPKHLLVAMLFVLAAILIGLNKSFYLFLAKRRGLLFAVAAIPFHMLYHSYNGFSVAAGLLKYFWRRFGR